MEINLEPPHLREKAPSIIDIKNKIRLGHHECCDCYCCKLPEFQSYKYIQPKIPKSFRPIRSYQKMDVPIDDNTTYKLSFWPEKVPVRKPIVPEGWLKVADGHFTNDTTHKMSYLGNWYIKPQEKILPCVRNWFGRGPIQDVTTQKSDFAWKYGGPEKPIKYRGNLALPKGHLAGDTTYKLSYYNSNNVEPIKSFKPIRHYKKSDEPIDDSTTYRLSFFNNEPHAKEIYPWQNKPKYEQPMTPVDDSTTYKLSYFDSKNLEPIKSFRPIRTYEKSDVPIENDTTYNLSYFSGDGDRPGPILPSHHQIFEDTPIPHDTTHKMSYFGNWRPKPEKLIVPCTRQMLGRGPMQDDTTQKRDFIWKFEEPPSGIYPQGNLTFSPAPVEPYTTNRLSYMPNRLESLTPNKSFVPIRKYKRADEPMDLNTTMKVSYMGVGTPEKIDMPWAAKPAYQKPTTQLDDSTTYDLSYIPPGTLEPAYESSPILSSQS